MCDCDCQDEVDPAFRGRSLEIKWAAPTMNEEYGDFFGGGGSSILVGFLCVVRDNPIICLCSKSGYTTGPLEPLSPSKPQNAVITSDRFERRRQKAWFRHRLCVNTCHSISSHKSPPFT